MKTTLLALCLIASCLAFGQTQGFQSGRYTITRNTATTNVTPVSLSDGTTTTERYEVRNGTTEGQGSLLLVIVNRFFFWFNASPTLAEITQEGTSGSWQIPVTTGVTTNKTIFMPQRGIAIVYNASQFGFDNSGINPFPLEIRALVSGQPTGALKCTILSDGNVIWPDISKRTAAAFGTTGLVTYTIQ